MKFYDRRAWRDRASPAHLAMEPLCRMCRARGVIRPATQVDHIVPIDAGGDPWSHDNMQSLCDTCHGLKTRAEHGATVSWGCDAQGLPADPAHPWNREAMGGVGKVWPIGLTTDGALEKS